MRRNFALPLSGARAAGGAGSEAAAARPRRPPSPDPGRAPVGTRPSPAGAAGARVR